MMLLGFVPHPNLPYYRTNGASEFSFTQARERMREDKNALLADQLNMA
jgi:hypothetical protein